MYVYLFYDNDNNNYTLNVKFGAFSINHAGLGHAHRGDVAGYHKEPRIPQNGLPPLPSRATVDSRSSVQPGGHRPTGEAASVRVQEQNTSS